MIHGVLIFNNDGKPRLMNWYKTMVKIMNWYKTMVKIKTISNRIEQHPEQTIQAIQS